MHAIESMLYKGTTPWHGLGKKVPDEINLDIQETIKQSGLNWTVRLERLKTASSNILTDTYATIRDSDNSILGVVGNRYRILQNIKAFDFFQPFLDTKLVEIHTAGSLFNGKKIWVLTKIKGDPLRVTNKENDSIDRYLLLSTGHDKATPVKVGFTPVRVVCWNTLSLAHSNEASKLIKIRHTASMENNLSNVRETIDVINNEFVATVNQYKKLADKGIDQETVRKYVREVLDTERFSIIDKVLELYQIDPNKGTVWGAYNSVTAYLSHFKGKNTEKRLNNLWFGVGLTKNELALEIALALAA